MSIPSSIIRTRYAPSPTGPLHVGGARTALFNYLFAKKYGGVFVLRIEDTDLERSDPKYEQDIFDSLKWLGIEWDEGPANPVTNNQSPITNNQLPVTNSVGDYGPYRQSERLETYKKYLEKLLAEGGAFYCFHTEAELEAERERMLTEKTPPAHVCEYRNRDVIEAQKLLREKPEHIIRFKTVEERSIAFHDLIRGDINFASNLIGDFSLAKDLLIPLYNFAVVVDDYEMKISHVIRGEDHISNTPKQILIQESLGIPQPKYAHLPLILGKDRSKLSKRHGASSVAEYRNAGYLPEALVNFMALLGWNPGDNREIFSMAELVEAFDIGKTQKSGAVFDTEKLDWLNGEYIRKKSPKDLTELCLPYFCDFLKFQIPNSKFQISYIERVVSLEQPRLRKLSEVGERTEYFFRAPLYDKELLRWKNMNDAETLISLESAEKIISNFQFSIFKKREIEKVFFEEIGAGDKGRMLWPLRIALTGKRGSPGPFEIIEILGGKETIKRIQKAKGVVINSR